MAPSPTKTKNGTQVKTIRGGDFTAREKARQAKEQQESNEADSAVTTRRRRQDADDVENGVHDPRSGQRINRVRAVADEDEETEEFDLNQLGRPRGSDRDEGEHVFTGKESEEFLNEMAVEARTARPKNFEEALSPIVLVRVNQDVEKFTFGMNGHEPNTFNLKENLVYKLPRAVAVHLDDLGYIGQWVKR